MNSSTTIQRELEERAARLAERLEHEEAVRAEYRAAGRKALAEADRLLQSVEISVAQPHGGALSARGSGKNPLPPIQSQRPGSTD